VRACLSMPVCPCVSVCVCVCVRVCVCVCNASSASDWAPNVKVEILKSQLDTQCTVQNDQRADFRACPTGTYANQRTCCCASTCCCNSSRGISQQNPRKQSPRQEEQLGTPPPTLSPSCRLWLKYVCVCACVRVCARACVCVRVHVRAFMIVYGSAFWRFEKRRICSTLQRTVTLQHTATYCNTYSSV